MIFLKPEDYLNKIIPIFEKMRERILQILPEARVEHIGSSAIKDVISKGDLDILIRVPKEVFNEALVKIQSLGFSIKEGTLRTESLCMLETKEFKEDVAIQLIEAGSKFEDFIVFRDRLNANKELREQYNELKRHSTGLSAEEYREKKSMFINSVLSDF